MAQGDHDEALRDASGEARRMGRLVSDLLTVARGGTVQEAFQAVRLDGLLEGAWRTARLLSERRRFDLGVLESATIDGDQDALKQMALILLENAVKYTPDDGLVRLESKLLAGWVEFSVSDGGFGIPAEELPRIFERFYRADLARTHGNHPGGNGLGLTIAKRIAENHGGEIRVESEFGRGTTFTVRLPVVVNQD